MNEKPAAEQPPAETVDDSAWARDIERRDYYYDDSHGYEIYDPEAEDDDEDDCPPE